MTQPRLVILDLDNTLWDATGALERGARAYVAEIARIAGISEDRALLHIQAGFAAGAPSFAQSAEFSDALQRLFPGQDPGFIFGPARRAFEAAVAAATTPYPGAVQAVAELRRQGVRVVCYTESRDPWLGPILARLGIDFDHVYCAAPLPFPAGMPSTPTGLHPGGASPAGPLTWINRRRPKTDVEALRLILAAEGVPAADCVAIGDRADRDLKPAAALGIRGIWASYGAVDLPADRLMVRLGFAHAGRQGGEPSDHGLSPAVARSPSDLTALLLRPAPPKPRLRRPAL